MKEIIIGAVILVTMVASGCGIAAGKRGKIENKNDNKAYHVYVGSVIAGGDISVKIEDESIVRADLRMTEPEGDGLKGYYDIYFDGLKPGTTKAFIHKTDFENRTAEMRIFTLTVADDMTVTGVEQQVPYADDIDSVYISQTASYAEGCFNLELELKDGKAYLSGNYRNAELNNKDVSEFDDMFNEIKLCIENEDLIERAIMYTESEEDEKYFALDETTGNVSMHFKSGTILSIPERCPELGGLMCELAKMAAEEE